MFFMMYSFSTCMLCISDDCAKGLSTRGCFLSDSDAVPSTVSCRSSERPIMTIQTEQVYSRFLAPANSVSQLTQRCYLLHDSPKGEGRCSSNYNLIIFHFSLFCTDASTTFFVAASKGSTVKNVTT